MSADGGPAFAAPSGAAQAIGAEEWSRYQRGMSLRDYFAAKALLGVIHCQFDKDVCIEQLAEWDEMLSEAAYKIADAMLKQRTK